MMRIVVSAALLALAASCGGGGGGPGTGGTGGGATAGAGGASTGGVGGASGAGPGGTGGAAPSCGNPSAVVSCTLATGEACQEALVNDTANAVRFFCTGGATLTEGAACPRNAQLAGCCRDPAMRLANCYYAPAEAETGRTTCAQAGNVWCDP